MQELLDPAAYPAFLAALQEPAPVSIRLNPAKPSPSGLPLSTLAPVPWHPRGCYLPERPVFTLDPAFHAGAYYVQEASSMFLYAALRQTADFSRPLRALDLCAAPGGKSTLLADMLNPAGLLVANEVIRPRTAILRENLEKWGVPNLAVSGAEVEEYAALEDFFDVVVTDAPCSGEGLFRKDPDAVKEWSPASVELCWGRQRRILAAAVSDMSVHGRNGDLESYLLADKVFHRTLLEASGNEMFRSLTGVVNEVLAGRTHHGMMPATPNPVAIALHDDVARAIRLRDPEAAEASMRAIITEAAAAVSPPPPEVL